MADNSVVTPNGTNRGFDSVSSFSEDAFEHSNRIWQIFVECRSEGRPYPGLEVLDRLINDQ